MLDLDEPVDNKFHGLVSSFDFEGRYNRTDLISGNTPWSFTPIL